MSQTKDNPPPVEPRTQSAAKKRVYEKPSIEPQDDWDVSTGEMSPLLPG